MLELKVNPEFSFTQEETEKMEKTAETIICLMRGMKNLTHAEAREVLRICEIKIQRILLD